MAAALVRLVRAALNYWMLFFARADQAALAASAVDSD